MMTMLHTTAKTGLFMLNSERFIGPVLGCY